jgi:acid stress-induced BolA-like protein IbaG/YrbA
MTALDYSEKWNHKVVEALLECEPGLVTGDQLSYEILRVTECIRGRSRAVLRALVVDGILWSGSIRHHDDQMDTYDIDDAAHERLRELLGSVSAF